MNNGQRKPKILVVDDDRLAIIAMADMLSHAGYEVLAATDTASCVEQMKSNRDHIDLVIIDVNLGFESGFDLADILEKDFRFHRQAFMTAYFWQEKTFRQLLERGKPYFEKPLKYQSELLPFLRDYFSKRKG